jgi:inward rectifier potassium channel
MNHPSFDPGLTQKYSGTIRRIINHDGSFNVHRHGVGLRNLNFYQLLINISWPKFLILVVAAYFLCNAAFAGVYLALGVENLQGVDAASQLEAFLGAFYFSVHTFTTVGYGTIAPKGVGTNLVAAFEAMTGLMSFALATGLLYGRFSRPSARIMFSNRLLITPYQDKTSLQFRITNQRTNMLMDMDAKMLLMLVERAGGQLQRKYFDLKLERPSIYFFPLTWTIVHPIDSTSPLFGKTNEDLASLQAEIMILVKGFDDTFSQVVHARNSYRYDEIVWGGRFLPIFHIDEHGDIVLQIDRLNDIEQLQTT